jgi:hypothetical protein
LGASKLGSLLAMPNDPIFSGERRTVAQAYHGREEVRAKPVPSRHQPTFEREV